MAAEQECFLHRVQEIPVVSASLIQALSLYDRTKNYNRLFGATFNLAENGVKYAVDKAQPVRKIFDGPIVATSKLACHQLDKLEEKYPMILATPEELINVGKQYYSKSYVKSGVDTALSVKDYGVSKVNNSKQLAADLVNGVWYGGQTKVVDVLRLGLLAVDNVLNYSDSLVDRYIAPPNYVEKGPKNSDDNSFAMNRIANLSSKVSSGLKYKAVKGYVASKDYAVHLVGQLQATFVLLEYAKNAGLQNEELMSKLVSAQEQVLALWREIQKRAHKYGSTEAALLGMAKMMSHCFASLSDQVFKYSTPYLSEGIEKNAASVVQYAHDLDDALSKATKLGDIKDEVVNEAKQGLEYARSVFVVVLDRVSVYPPVSWLSLNLDPIDLFDDDDDFYGDLFDLNQEHRRPLNLHRFVHIGLPIIEPRDSNPARSG